MSTVFYSWQSDLPETRNVIETSLKKAIRNLNRDLSVEEALRLDQDTQGVPGWPDITEALFDKIDRCEVFVADITPINGPESPFRITPNPNVLLELGYALGTGFGRTRIICVINTHYLRNDDLRELPFDLRGSRPIRYSLEDHSLRGVKPGQEDPLRIRVRNELTAKFEDSILAVLQALDEARAQSDSEIAEDNLTPESRLVLNALVARIDRDGLPYHVQSDGLQLVRLDLGMSEQNFIKELTRLDREGYVEFEHRRRGLDSCRIGSRGVLLSMMHSDYQRLDVALREVADLVYRVVASEGKQLSVGEIIRATGYPSLLVNAVLDHWDQTELIQVVRTLGGIESDTVWQASPLLQEEVS